MFPQHRTERMSTVPVAFLLQKLAKFLEVRHGLDVRPTDLNFEMTGGEQIPNGYTLLDLIIFCSCYFQSARSFRREL